MSNKKTFSINLDYNNNLNLSALTLVAKIVGPRLGNTDVRLTFMGDNNLVDYRHLTPNTVNYFMQLFTTDNLDNIKDSSDNPLSSYLNYHTVTLEFVPRKKGRRIAAGFYPYWNISDIDLSKFGIYSKTSKNISEPCLLTAIKNSEFCTEESAKMLEYFIKTRMVLQTYLADIAELLKIHINLKIMYDNGKSSHRDYGEEYKVCGSIKLFILHGHYFLNSDVNVTELYVKKYNEIHNIHKFAEHPRRFMLKKFNVVRHEFSKTGTNIMKILKLMTEANLLIPMSEKEISELSWAYEPCRTINFEGYSRPIVIPDVKKCNKYYKHGVTTEHSKAENEYDKLIEEVREAKRVKGKTELLPEKARHLKQEYDKVAGENNILKLQESVDAMQTELTLQKHDNALLKNVVNESKMKGEIEKLKHERDLSLAENKGMREYLKTPEYTQPQEEITRLMKEKLQAEEEHLYLSKLIELRKQNAELNLQKAAIPEVTEISDKTLAAIQNQISENEKVKSKITEKQRKYNLYQSRIKKQEDMDAAAEDLQYEEYKTNAKISALHKPTRIGVKKSIRNAMENKVRKE